MRGSFVGVAGLLASPAKKEHKTRMQFMPSLKIARTIGASLFLLGAALAGCGDDDRGPTTDGGLSDSAVDAFADANEQDGGSSDGGVEDGGTGDAGEDASLDARPDAEMDFPGCVPGMPFRVAEGFTRTQVHPAVARDGDRIWVAFTSAQEEGSALDVGMVELHCDGTIAEPFRVVDEIAPNDGDPTLAVSGDHLHIVWQRDAGEGVMLAHRIYTTEGEVVLGDTNLELERNGVIHDGTTWMPYVLPSDDGVDLIGSWGVTEASAFQVFRATISSAGIPSEGVETSFTEGEQQTNPMGVRTTDGLALAWTQGDPESAYIQVGDADAEKLTDAPRSSTPHLATSGDALLASLQVGLPPTSEVRLIHVGGDVATIATRGAVTPWLATNESGGGAVLYLSNVRGVLASAMHARPFRFDGSEFTLGEPLDLPVIDTVPGIYRPAIHHIQGDIYLIVWAEGDNPEFEIWARFVELSVE